MKALHMIAWILLIIGGLNWGLVGIGGFAGADWNIVELIFGAWPALLWIIYILVGLSALWLIFKPKHSMMGSSMGSSSAM